MRCRTSLFVTLLMGLVCSPASAGLTFYSDPSSFASQTSGMTTDTFGGVVPDNGFQLYSNATYTAPSGTTYSIDKTTSNGNLFIIGKDFYGPGSAPSAFISSQQSSTVTDNFSVAFAKPVYALSFSFASFEPVPITFVLSTGDTFIENPQGASMPGTFTFVGLTSTTAFTSFTMTQAADGGGIELANVSFGNLGTVSPMTAVPEPSSLAMVGIASILGMVASGRRKAKVLG